MSLPLHVVALAAVLLGASLPAHADLAIFATVPEWGALATELGGDKVKVYTATNALQDPHHVVAKPSLIARARSADLLVATGAELEIGWVPLVVQQAGNPKIRPGQPGYFEAASVVPLLDRPAKLDRADGDVHPLGDPHIQTDPRNIALVATALGKRLQQIDPAHADDYAKHQADFTSRWQQATARWTAQAAPLKGAAVVSQHNAFVYLYDWLGIKEVAVLEPKPGVEPTASHLQEVVAKLKDTPPKMVIHAAYQDSRPSDWLSKNAGIPAVKLPFTVGGTEGAKDLFGLFDDTIARMLAAGTRS
jgi:zinc/manganese transport system substrate-binding protein